MAVPPPPKSDFGTGWGLGCFSAKPRSDNQQSSIVVVVFASKAQVVTLLFQTVKSIYMTKTTSLVGIVLAMLAGHGPFEALPRGHSQAMHSVRQQ